MSALSERSYEKLGRAASMVISHVLFRRALNLAIQCMERSQYRQPPPGLLIMGPSGCGKTTLARELLRIYPPSETAEGSFLPVLFVQTPANPTIKSLAETILLGLAVSAPSRLTTEQLTRLIIKWLKARRVQVIVVDEVQHLAERNQAQVRVTADYFKVLINEAGLPIILLGLESAQLLLEANEQLRRRFTSKVELSRFLYQTSKEQVTFQNFLRAVGKECGFELEVPLDAPELAQRMYWATAGLPAHVMNIVLGAAERALREGRSEIAVTDLGYSFTDYVWENGFGKMNPFSADFVARDLMLSGEPFEYLADNIKPKRAA